MQHPHSRAAWLAALMLTPMAGSALAGSVPSNPDAITVGKTTDANCTNQTVQDAINEAKTRWNAGRGRQEIRITRDVAGGIWSNVNALIKDMDVTIIGGFADCDTDDIDGNTVVSGAGGEREPVFSIEGQAEVTLQHLYIIDGDADNDEAGGIDFRARGGLRIENSLLIRNTGEEGGGLRFEAVGGMAELYLASNVQVLENKADTGGGVQLVGNGTAAAAYLHTGSNVVIKDNRALAGDGGGIASRGHAYLDLQGPNSQVSNNTATGDGGGVEFDGPGEVTLERFIVSHNIATYGAGLHLAGGGGGGLFTVGDDVTIGSNTARNNGGGLHVEGKALLTMQARGTWVVDNQSAERGGGLYVKGPARANIGAAGTSLGVAVFQYNRAKRGGAIAVNGGSDDGYLSLFTAHPDMPMTISSNTASERGGGVYGIGEIGGGWAYMCIEHTSMYDNRAAQGAAVFADTDNNVGPFEAGKPAKLTINKPDAVCAPPPSARACEGPFCNQFTFNQATAADGAVIETSDQPDCGTPCSGFPGSVGAHEVRNLVIRNNTAATLFRGRMDIQAQNIAGYENTLSVGLAQGNVSLRHASFAANGGGSAYALNMQDGVVYSSIFLLPAGQGFLNPAGSGSVAAQYTLSNDLSGLTRNEDTNFQTDDPGFVDAQLPGIDLHLREDAAAIDSAPVPTVTPRWNTALDWDLEGQPRVIDYFGRGQGYPADRGAYELQIPRLFYDGFELRPN